MRPPSPRICGLPAPDRFRKFSNLLVTVTDNEHHSLPNSRIPFDEQTSDDETSRIAQLGRTEKRVSTRHKLRRCRHAAAMGSDTKINIYKKQIKFQIRLIYFLCSYSFLGFFSLILTNRYVFFFSNYFFFNRHPNRLTAVRTAHGMNHARYFNRHASFVSLGFFFARENRSKTGKNARFL